MNMRCRIADWSDDGDTLRAIRQTVFVQEQHVPVELEWDGQDAAAIHFIAEHDGEAVATARLRFDDILTAQVGRIAVLKPFRRQGIGSMLLKTLLEYCDQQAIRRLYLHAQLEAVGLYEKFGFKAEGEIFSEAGIDHRAMSRICAKKEL